MTPVRLSPATKGLSLTRLAVALAYANGFPELAASFADTHFRGDPVVAEVLKAAISANTTDDPAYGGALVHYGLAGDFLEAVRGRTVLDRLLNTRRAPFLTDFPRETTAATAGWVGEAEPRPVSRSSFDTVRLERYLATAISVVTRELVRNFRPGNEFYLHGLLVSAVAEHLDSEFLDPERPGSAGVSPASITYAGTRVTQTGATAGHAGADLADVVDAIATPMRAPIWIMPPRAAARLASWSFEGVKVNGGTLFGIPVLCTQTARPVGSPSASLIVLLDAPEIIIADEGLADVEASDVATVVMDTAPSAPAEAESMFQTDSLAIKVRREIAWKAAHDNAVAFLEATW
jgi:HK97 family phage major capsid protein